LIPSWFPGSLPADVWLRRAKIPASPWDAAAAETDAEGLTRLDIRIADSNIAAVALAGIAEEGIDLDRGQIWPCFVDGHVHPDKTRTRQPIPFCTHASAKGAVILDRGKCCTVDDIDPCFSVEPRRALAHGTAAIRTHPDSYSPNVKARRAAPNEGFAELIRAGTALRLTPAQVAALLTAWAHRRCFPSTESRNRPDPYGLAWMVHFATGRRV
jgi:hypothetical protein